MKYSTNYNLKLPEGSDFYDVQDFDDNFTGIDTQMKANADAIANINTELDGVADALAAI